MTNEDRLAIIRAISRYGNSILSCYPSYLVHDNIGNIPLRVLVHILSLYGIDTVKQRFECRLLVQFRWFIEDCDIISTKLKENGQDEIDVSDIDTVWKPQLDFMNQMGELKVHEKTKIFKRRNDKEGYEIIYTQIIQGQFYEKFEVRGFPFDCQRLQLYAVLKNCPHSVVISDAENVSSGKKLTSNTLKRRMGANSVAGSMLSYIYDFKDDSDNGSGNSVGGRTYVNMNEIHMPTLISFVNDGTEIYKENFVQSDSWRLSSMIDLREGYTMYDRNEKGISFTTLRIVMNVERRFGFYFWNLVFPVFILVTLSFTSFLFDTRELSNKMSVTLTLILTMFALKFAASQYIPPTNYLTYLDKYIVGSYVMLCAVALQNILTNVIMDKSHMPQIARSFNKISGWLMTAGWISSNTVIFIMIMNKRWRRILVGEMFNDKLYLREKSI